MSLKKSLLEIKITIKVTKVTRIHIDETKEYVISSAKLKIQKTINELNLEAN